jgi:hypothetical protein
LDNGSQQHARPAQHYILATYLIVFILAAALVLASLFFTTSPDWKSAWINLGTSLLGVVVLFFLAHALRAARDGEWLTQAPQWPERHSLLPRGQQGAFAIHDRSGLQFAARRSDVAADRANAALRLG